MIATIYKYLDDVAIETNIDATKLKTNFDRCFSLYERDWDRLQSFQGEFKDIVDDLFETEININKGYNTVLLSKFIAISKVAVAEDSLELIPFLFHYVLEHLKKD